MHIFIHCKTTLHVSGVTAPIIRSIRNSTLSFRYGSYYLYRRLRVQFLILVMLGAVTPETCRVPLQWMKIYILLHLLGFYSHWITMLGNTSIKFNAHQFATHIQWNWKIQCSSVRYPHPVKLKNSMLISSLPTSSETDKFNVHQFATHIQWNW